MSGIYVGLRNIFAPGDRLEKIVAGFEGIIGELDAYQTEAADKEETLRAEVARTEAEIEVCMNQGSRAGRIAAKLRDILD